MFSLTGNDNGFNMSTWFNNQVHYKSLIGINWFQPDNKTRNITLVKKITDTDKGRQEEKPFLKPLNCLLKSKMNLQGRKELGSTF